MGEAHEKFFVSDFHSIGLSVGWLVDPSHWTEMFQQLLVGLPLHFVQGFTVPTG